MDGDRLATTTRDFASRTRRAGRWQLALLAALLAPGCYLSHELPLDGPDADVTCAPPPRETMTVDAEILSSSPDGCAVVGTRFRREISLAGGPLTAGCDGDGAVIEPTDDGCGLRVSDHCSGVELDRQVEGTLRGPDASGLVTLDERRGYTFAECRRVERWTRAR